MSFATGSFGLGTSPAGVGWGNSLKSEPFPDPFMDYASLAMPETIQHALRWCEFIALSNGTYREATRRLLAYFITDVDIQEGTDESKDRWRSFLDETLNIKNMLHTVGFDLMIYGNSFTSVIPTFMRFLMCPSCRRMHFPLRQVMDNPSFEFSWSNFTFRARCPGCNYSGEWRVSDRPTGEGEGFRVKRWSPHDIELLWDPWTDEIKYIWKIPEDYRRLIREGRMHVLEHAPMQVIQAVKENRHLLFEKDFIHHMREDALAGVNNRGWGISRVLTNFRQAWYVQVLHRYNEAIALDYVIPFRVVTPAPGDRSGGIDILSGHNAGGYMAQIHAMLRRRRRDPASWHTLPFPVQYQALGGDAKQMTPDTLIAQGQDTLLNSIGVPAELYKGSMTLQSAAVGLRLFEASQSSIPHNFNGFLRFVVRKSAAMLRWDPITARLTKVTHADDANRAMTKLQLMSSGMVSQTTGLKTVGLSLKDEIRQMMDDQQFQAEETARLQERMEQASQMKQMSQFQPGGAPGQPPGQPGQPGQPAAPPQGGGQAGGAPPPGQPGMPGASIVDSLPQGPNQQITPEEQLSRAQYLASAFMGMPEAQKDSELNKLKRLDPNLHAITRAQMDAIRQQARLQGGNMVLAQQFGKQGVDATDASDASMLQKAAGALRRRLRRVDPL